MTNSEVERAPQDLTARARIRDAALCTFAERGFDGATIRGIAKQAGVSGGLVRHHFGSKADLRSECDAYALAQIMRIKERAIADGQLADVGFMSASHPMILLVYRYLARSLVDGSPAAASTFDEMVELAEQWLDRYHPGEMTDPHAYAALFVAMEIGGLTMHTQLSRALGADVLSPAGHLRLSAARVDFYSRPLLSREVAAQAHSTIEHLRAERTADPTTPSSTRAGR